MRSQRGGWLGSTTLAAIVVLVPAAATVRAQPGFGADPFWPYNQQYTPYTTPMGPASPEGGGQIPAPARDGLRGANQFQDYLQDMSGPGRNISDRSNIGMPYYRSAVDPDYDTGRGLRQYEPNARSRDNFDEAQRRAAELYFRYYTERDPVRRAELLREYREARREEALALSGRGRTASRTRDAAASRETRAGQAPRPGAPDRTRSRAGGIGAAPEVPPISSLRSSASRPRRSLPSDVLNRSEAMDDDRTTSAPRSPGRPAPRPGPVAAARRGPPRSPARRAHRRPPRHRPCPAAIAPDRPRRVRPTPPIPGAAGPRKSVAR